MLIWFDASHPAAPVDDKPGELATGRADIQPMSTNEVPK